ncbi:NUDIX domain-containing protein [Microtetraspora sp. NBRC 13810]|uniref:NUDIX hydrolase n=1 Tax=Microtetraspora sp. NBRC 13810 TaxID=3030990 RepID=UPI0025546E34|nr:NUDIX domain-containing protein [Microtetraspora sp. NBRC 13810]
MGRLESAVPPPGRAPGCRTVALIRRDQPGSVHYTLPGGNVRPGEPLADALCRELAEELLLDVGDSAPARLVWIQDQMITRPGPTPPPRKLHMIYRLHVTGRPGRSRSCAAWWRPRRRFRS